MRDKMVRSLSVRNIRGLVYSIKRVDFMNNIYLIYAAEQDNEKTIVYDDSAVERLLDRTLEGQEEKEEAMNEYLSSFKVASYQVKEGDEDVSPVNSQLSVTLIIHHFDYPPLAGPGLFLYYTYAS